MLTFGPKSRASTTEALTVTPFQVVKVRLQAKAYLGRYTSTLQCAQRVIAEEGIATLANGFGATVCSRPIPAVTQILHT